jgi:hypothetical protein
MTKVIIRKAELDFMLNNPSGEVGRYLAKKGRIVQAAARAQVGVRTGALRASIHMRHLRDSRGQYVKIGSALNYALLHHEGSKPHLIVPNRATVLKFATRGRVVYAHAVMHPGTKANRYLTDNLKLVK